MSDFDKTLHAQLRHLIDDLTVAVDDDGHTRYAPKNTLMFSNFIGALIELMPTLAARAQPAQAVPSDVVRDAELDARVAEAEAKWQATIRDAARYRWLREADDDADKLIQADCRGVYLPQTEALDRRIDAAMAQGANHG